MAIEHDPADVRRNRRRRFTRLTLMVLAPYALVVGLVTAFQRSLIYHPFRKNDITVDEAGLPPGRVHDVEVRTEDDLTLHGWLSLADGQPARADELQQRLAEGRPLIAYFSGNAANRRYRSDVLQTLNRLGADVLIVDYRGYGDNEGEPSEEGLANDARAVWRHATEDLGVEPERVLLYGESLGGAVATRLAWELCRDGSPPAGMIVRSTFSSLTDAGKRKFPWLPVRLCLVDRYPSDARIGEVTCPYLHLHGTKDDIVPIDLGQKLFAAAPPSSSTGVPKQFVELPRANHNDVLFTSREEYKSAVGAFLQAAVPTVAAE